MKKWLLPVCFAAISCGSVFAQGQIFSKAEADQLFGQAITKIPISKSVVRQVLAQCPNKVLFAINQNGVIFANPKKETLHNSAAVNAASIEVYRVIASSVLSDFLDRSTEETVYVEQRAEVYSLTNGEFTLEKVGECPPYCE